VAIKCPKCHSENPETKQFCADCGTQLAPLSKDVHSEFTETLKTPIHELTTGSTFAGRYQIIEELGKGGMGKVYKVFDAKIKEKIALKLIKAEIAQDQETIERFGNELRLARKIAHRHVCRMFDLGEAEGGHFITMEYVPGEDLKTMIRMSGQLGIGTSIHIARQIGEGLSEAHRLGVIHRDLKSSNIMLDREGHVRIMDFGIARTLKERGITGAGVIIGTPEYMSPEQVEGKDIDGRSDIYSLGIILYEMLTGRVPFEGDTPFAVGIKQKSEIPKDPKLLNAHIPEDLGRIVLKCLEKDKAKRFQSAEELVTELARLERGIPSTQMEIPRPKPLTSREFTVKFNLKKLALPFLVLALIAVIALSYFLFIAKKGETPLAASKKSVAVLSFADLSPAKDREYLCDGIAETLINALSRIEELRVPAATSAFSFKGKGADIKEIGQKLAVEAVLEGSIQIAGDRLRVNAQLINVNNGYHIWSEKYDRGVEDVFAVQDDIAQKIVEALKIKMLGEREAQVVKRHTENREAYDLYMQGVYLLSRRGKKNLEKAVEFFQEATKKDANYALAYAQIAETYATIGDSDYLPPREAFPKAREAVERALEIDSSIAEAHTALAEVKYIYDWDRESAEKEFKRAISLNPNYAIAHKEYAEYLMSSGRFDEAQRALNKAKELDPLSLPILSMAAKAQDYSGRYDQAIEQCKRVLEMDPNFELARFYLHIALLNKHLAKGMYEDALEECQKSNDHIWAGIVYAKMGKKDEAQNILMDLISQSEHSPNLTLSVAGLFFALKDNDQGFQWLEKAYEYKLPGLARLKIRPECEGVRDDPRFKDMLRRVGLEK
jgi:serine/threonine-protein kinase